MQKEADLEKRAMEALADPACDAATKRWLVLMNVNSHASLIAAAKMNRLPSVSMAAFSKIRDERARASILIEMFSSEDRSNLISIGYEVIGGIESKTLLWDIFQSPAVPKELKSIIEARIGQLSGMVEPRDYREIIRLQKGTSRR